jgi:hypothetical protein
MDMSNNSKNKFFATTSFHWDSVHTALHSFYLSQKELTRHATKTMAFSDLVEQKVALKIIEHICMCLEWSLLVLPAVWDNY